jgi:hypothetical protein
VNVGRVRAVRLGGTKNAGDRMAIKGTELEVVVVGGGLLIHVSAICSQCGTGDGPGRSMPPTSKTGDHRS